MTRLSRSCIVATLAGLALALTAVAGSPPQRLSEDEYSALLLENLRRAQPLILDSWGVDDGRTVSVMWDFTAPDPLRPVVEIPRAGDYWWYEGSKATLHPGAILTPEGVLLSAATSQPAPDDDPDVIGILDVEDTNPPEENKIKDVTLVYCWHRQGGGTAPPGPTVTIEPSNANITGISRRIVGNCEQVTVTMTIGPPCPPSVKASFSRAPGGPKVVIKSASINGVCTSGTGDVEPVPNEGGFLQQ